MWWRPGCRMIVALDRLAGKDTFLRKSTLVVWDRRQTYRIRRKNREKMYRK